MSSFTACLNKDGRFIGRFLCAIIFAFVLVVGSAQAGERGFLSRDQPPDFLALLPPPPTDGEQVADMASAASVHGLAPTNEVAAAKSEGNFSEFVFSPAVGGFFKAGKLPKTEAFFRRLRADSDDVVD